MGSSTTKKPSTTKSTSKKPASKPISTKKAPAQKAYISKPGNEITKSTRARTSRKAKSTAPAFSLHHANDNNDKDVNYKSASGYSDSQSEDWSEDLDSEDGKLDKSESSSDSEYGDLEETGGQYRVAMEVSIEQHARLCGCDLTSKTSRCRRV